MSFTGTEGESIDHKLAGQWTRNHREANPSEIQGHFFGHKILENILQQKGCIGIRMYYALDEENNRHLVLVGVDKDRNDMLNGPTAADGQEDVPAADELTTTERMPAFAASFLVGNDGKPSPPYSSDDNILNS
ncbi:hypothetical protein [Hymenobacter sp. GOD-10R]|uniref:hypothetical protein n=1 Tax=Hymenobacter sp. GOD-10R TaxID=3093922 RepID=UPI002D79F6AA|nr:hypothetical protein [Hymenobacter sp. GOD-10R]WRQ27324.1 hypothetical protein SD425_19820 [Hymenobacter sp. GOD-10R]